LWGLTAPEAGENRFVVSAAVTAQLRGTAPLCDLIVGTEEEFHILGGSTDTLAALRAVRACTAALLVCKLGAVGCAAHPWRPVAGLGTPAAPSSSRGTAARRRCPPGRSSRPFSKENGRGGCVTRKSWSTCTALPRAQHDRRSCSCSRSITAVLWRRWQPSWMRARRRSRHSRHWLWRLSTG